MSLEEVEVKFNHIPLNSYILPYSGQKFYQINILGLIRQLPLIKINNNTWIAYLGFLGDTQLAKKVSKHLLPYFRKTDIIVTTESTGIPLAHDLARILDHDFYVVCRKKVKGLKSNISNYFVENYKPTTSKGAKMLLISSKDAALVKNKRVGLVDDVTASFSTLKAMNNLVERAGGSVVQCGVAMLEGIVEANIPHAGTLPLFKV